VTQSLSTPHSDLIAKLYAERLRPAGDQSRTDGKPPYWHDNSTSDLLLHAAIALSETGTVEPEHLQDAPRVAREKFKVPNPFPHDPKKPEQSEISVVFSSFAACIERETNTLRSLTPSAREPIGWERVSAQDVMESEGTIQWVPTHCKAVAITSGGDAGLMHKLPPIDASERTISPDSADRGTSRNG
jgi:hypothetical protein